MNKINILAIVCAVGISACDQSQTKNENSSVESKTSIKVASFLPESPIGYRWQLVENMSDEFDGVDLNTHKWKDQIDTWKGRPPAEFLAKNVSVANGSLAIKTSTHPNPTEEFTMAGAAVAGVERATYGYFEARVKASKTRMSTTFWLHSDFNENSDLSCEKRHSIELDILEAIGGWYTEDWTHIMHSNTHYKPNHLVDGQCKGAPYLSKGVKKHTGMNLSDDYHTFALWWVTPNKMHYYFDGESIGTVDVSHDFDTVPFDGEMSLRMVAETYTWQQNIAPDGKPAYPTEQELDDASINTAYYDHVRSYQLIAAINNVVKNGDFENEDDHWSINGERTNISLAKMHSYLHSAGLQVSPKGTVSQKVSVQKNQLYMLSVYAKNLSAGQGATIIVQDTHGNLLQSQSITSTTFDNVTMTFNSKEQEEIYIAIENKGNVVSVLDAFALVASK